MDGIITIFCFLAAGHGGGLGTRSIIWLGLGNLLGDAISMATAEYVSSSNEHDYEISERAREQWEMEHCLELEVDEMVQIYQSKHKFCYDDAKAIVDLQLKYPKYFLHNMMVEELGILHDPEETDSFLMKSLMMFLSFIIFGSIPLISYSVIMNFAAENRQV